MDTPYLVAIAPSQGSSEALVLIRGYLSEDSFTAKAEEEWKKAVRQAGWKGSIYHLWWECSSDSLWNIGRLHWRWEQVKSRAKQVGRNYLSELISPIPEKSVSLIGYSLGVRVIYYGLAYCSECPKIINNTILLGGAVRRNKEWGIRASKLTGKLVNVYNSQDEVLNIHFKIGELYLKSPCGLKPIKDVHPRIINVDATSAIATSDHAEKHYLRVLPETVGRRLWL
ncbi:MAG TPA: DUF726 domain-containing protein [Kamptonema sp.]|nr:DUF726 domain-containing protein [Kamptonema sp.]